MDINRSIDIRLKLSIDIRLKLSIDIRSNQSIDIQLKLSIDIRSIDIRSGARYIRQDFFITIIFNKTLFNKKGDIYTCQDVDDKMPYLFRGEGIHRIYRPSSMLVRYFYYIML